MKWNLPTMKMRRHSMRLTSNMTEALQTADNISTFKLVVKTIAKRHGLHATFMPKPKNGVDGSGMHINMSLVTSDGRQHFPVTAMILTD